MKHPRPYAILLSTLLFFLFCTACGGQGSQPAASSSQSGGVPSMKSGKTQKSTQPILKQQGVEISLEGVQYQDNERYLVLLLQVKNDTNQNIRLTTQGVSVEGVMVNANLHCEVGAGQTVSGELEFYCEELLEKGLSRLNDVDIRFSAVDDTNYESLFLSDVCRLDLRTPKMPESDFYALPEATPQELFSQNDITISYLETSEDSGWSYSINFLITNKSVLPVQVSLESLLVNGAKVSTFSSTQLLPNTLSYMDVSLFAEDLGQLGINTLSDLEVSFEIVQWDSYKKLATTEVYTLSLGDIPVAPITEG